MARARMLANKICRDKAVNNLSDDTSRLAFTWLITFADCEGRTFGDPALIRSALFPRRDITLERITKYITEWADAGLIVWYEFEDDQYIWFPKFEANQPGLRKDREPSSEIPEFNPDTCRMLSGSLTDECPVKRREEKLREEKEKDAPLPLTGCDSECENIYRAVTNQITIPIKERGDVIQAIQAIQRNKGGETLDYLRPFYKTFTSKYPGSTRMFWLTDWAIQGKIPVKSNGNGKPIKSAKEEGYTPA